MPGGGCLGVAPGQVTDDTELALALASALRGKRPADGFPADEAFGAYHAWKNSAPFDIGITCRNAFRSADREKRELSARSQSNGSLMRVAPLAAWASGEDDETIARLAAEDAALSHASGVVFASTAAYSIAVAALVRGESAAEAVARSTSWLEATGGDAAAVSEWLRGNDGDFSDATGGKQGWARHAFRLAFYHLGRGTPFADAMRHVLGVGGDTDTNAAIVGALLGARDGLSELPGEWVDAVREARTADGHPRPDAYHPLNFDDFEMSCK
jgi:ADP-ribosylglycohydrolase